MFYADRCGDHLRNEAVCELSEKFFVENTALQTKRSRSNTGHLLCRRPYEHAPSLRIKSMDLREGCHVSKALHLPAEPRALS